MTKQYFMQMAALNLIIANPTLSVQNISRRARILADILFDAHKSFEETTQTGSTEIEKLPVATLLAMEHVTDLQRTRLANIFIPEDIKTIGDLLRYGRGNLKEIRMVGPCLIRQLDISLKTLGIEKW